MNRYIHILNQASGGSRISRMEATYCYSHFSRKLYEIEKKDLVTFHVLMLGHKMISLITKSADWLPNHKQPDLSAPPYSMNQLTLNESTIDRYE